MSEITDLLTRVKEIACEILIGDLDDINRLTREVRDETPADAIERIGQLSAAIESAINRTGEIESAEFRLRLRTMLHRLRRECDPEWPSFSAKHFGHEQAAVVSAVEIARNIRELSHEQILEFVAELSAIRDEYAAQKANKAHPPLLVTVEEMQRFTGFSRRSLDSWTESRPEENRQGRLHLRDFELWWDLLVKHGHTPKMGKPSRSEVLEVQKNRA